MSATTSSSTSHWTDGPSSERSGAVAIFMLALFVLGGALVVLHTDLSRGFDERAHISYVAALQKSGVFWPTFDDLRLIDTTSYYFTDQLNYLNHPPIYYWLLAKLVPTIEGRPDSIIYVRALNLLFASGGFAAVAALAASLKLGRLETYAVFVPILFTPILFHVSGTITNDNLAFLGGGVALLAAHRVLATGQFRWALALLAGVVFAGFAKLTALVLVGTMALFVFGTMLWRGRLPLWWLAPMAIAGLLAAAPYLIFVAQYGSPAPDTPGAMTLLKCPSCTFVSEHDEPEPFKTIAKLEEADPENGWRYAPRAPFWDYARFFVTKFFVIWSGRIDFSPMRYALSLLPILGALLGLAGFAVSAKRMAQRSESPLDAVVVSGWLAIAVTFVCHLGFSYVHHVKFAHVADAYPRYYLPICAIVSLSALACLQLVRRPAARSALLGLMIMAPLAFDGLAAAITA